MSTPKIILRQTSNPNERNFLSERTLTEEQVQEIYYSSISQVKCMTAVVNQAAYSSMLEAYSLIKQTPLFRHEVKRTFNLAMAAYDQYINNLRHGSYKTVAYFQVDKLSPEEIAQGKRQVTNQELFDWWLDIGACAYKRSVKQREALRFQMYQALTYKRIDKYRKECSYISLADILLRYAADAYDVIIKDLAETYHLSFHDCFFAFSLRPVYTLFHKATEMVSVDIENLHLPKGLADSIETAFRAFEAAIMRDLSTAESANEAIDLNSDLIDPSLYREYRQTWDEAKAEYDATH